VESGERRYAHGFTSKDQAEKVRSLNAANLAAGRGGLPKPKGPGKTLAALAEEWLERRDATHRAARDDRHRWTNHLEPLVGDLEPDAVDTGILRKIVERKLAEKLAPATVLLLMRLLSTFYTDLIEQGHATKNPARMLPRSTKRLIRPSHDPKTTPFVERRADIVRIFKALPEPGNVAYAIGALAGLRTGEMGTRGPREAPYSRPGIDDGKAQGRRLARRAPGRWSGSGSQRLAQEAARR
jgi:hypothetical protein